MANPSAFSLLCSYVQNHTLVPEAGMGSPLLAVSFADCKTFPGHELWATRNQEDPGVEPSRIDLQTLIFAAAREIMQLGEQQSVCWQKAMERVTAHMRNHAEPYSELSTGEAMVKRLDFLLRFTGADKTPAKQIQPDPAPHIYYG